MNFNLYQLYQMADNEGNQDCIFQNYELLVRSGISVTAARYEKVCEGLLPDNTGIFEVSGMLEKKPRTILTQHSLSVSDVIVLVKGQNPNCFYVDEAGMIPLPDFFSSPKGNSTIQALTAETTGFSIPGKPGLWAVSDTIVSEGHTLFLMESEKYRRRVNRILLDAAGNIVMHENFNDFDQETLDRIRKYLHPDPITPQNLTNDRRTPSNGTVQRSKQDHRPSSIKAKRSDAPSQRRSVRQRLKEKERIVHSTQMQMPQTAAPAQ